MIPSQAGPLEPWEKLVHSEITDITDAPPKIICINNNDNKAQGENTTQYLMNYQPHGKVVSQSLPVRKTHMFNQFVS